MSDKEDTPPPPDPSSVDGLEDAVDAADAATHQAAVAAAAAAAAVEKAPVSADMRKTVAELVRSNGELVDAVANLTAEITEYFDRVGWKRA